MLKGKKKVLKAIENLKEKVVKKVEEMVKGGHYMGLVLNKEGKREILFNLSKFYKKGKKKEKGKILDFLSEYFDYNRRYIAWLLRGISLGKISSNKVRKRVRKRIYGEEESRIMEEFWKASDYICGKRLKPLVPVLIEKAEKFGGIEIRDEVKEKLKKMSAATIDRILKKERNKYRLKRRARTKPGTLLKKQIRVRTFSQGG